MHHNRHHFQVVLNTEMNELYLCKAIRSFAIGLINIFVPIYLINLGYSLFSVFMFIAVICFTHVVFTIPAAKFIARYGIKHSILFSIPFIIAYYLLLHTLPAYNWPLFILPMVSGFSGAFYWMGYHVDFSKYSDAKVRGQEVGISRIINLIFNLMGPAIGGLLLVFIGFKPLFLIVVVLLFGSAIPLFMTKDSNESVDINFKGIFKQRPGDYLGFTGWGIEEAVGRYVWPIFIFFAILNNYATLGIVASLSLVFSLMFVFIVGKLADINKRFMLRVGAVVTAAIWAIKTMVRTSLQVFMIDSVYGMAQTSFAVPFGALNYDKAQKSIMQYTLFREIMINLSRGLFMVAMAFISNLFVGMLFGIAGSILYMFF